VVSSPHDIEDRARDWRRGVQATVCDSITPWGHGSVLRATRYPDYYDYNLVRVEDDPGLDFDALASLADESLAGLAHRQISFELIAPADRLRPAFLAEGWRTTRLVWMHFDGGELRGEDGISVEEVSYAEADPLRAAWHREDFPDQPGPARFFEQSREVALARNVSVLGARQGEKLVAFAHVEREGVGAEITQVYVAPEHRGHGLGTAVTGAAIRASADAKDLWICADDEDRPKELYARLGFRPAWTMMDCLRLPS
jgi:ribosomal protein S18 acetylase RimI-like enzyme